MKLLLIAIAAMVVVSGPALACRAVNEYPQAFQRLDELTISPGRRAEFEERLRTGQAIHDQVIHDDSYSQDDKGKMRESLRILDKIKAEMGM